MVNKVRFLLSKVSSLLFRTGPGPT